MEILGHWLYTDKEGSSIWNGENLGTDGGIEDALLKAYEMGKVSREPTTIWAVMGDNDDDYEYRGEVVAFFFDKSDAETHALRCMEYLEKNRALEEKYKWKPEMSYEWEKSQEFMQEGRDARESLKLEYPDVYSYTYYPWANYEVESYVVR